MPLAYVVPRQTIEKYGDRWLMARPLPSSGPYELVYWRLNDKVRLKKNPLYWDAANTQSEIIDILPVGSPGAALNLYESGQADIVWDKELMPRELLDVLLKRPDFHTFNYLGTYFIRFNVTKKPFDDPRVRRALALAIDKKRIVEKITTGGEKPAASHFVPARHGQLHVACRDLVTIPRWRENCWPRPVIPAAGAFRDLNTCSTRRPAAATKFTKTSPSNCSRCGATSWASRWICARSNGRSF